MIRLEQDRPAVGPVPAGLHRFDGCALCGIPPFDSSDPDLVAKFAKAHQP